MQRLVYRKFADHESIVAVHSINTSAKAGGVRWYEFRLDAKGDPALYQQGTYAPDEFYRWMASPDMDHMGNIGIGYSFGGAPHFAGQRFAARMAGDPLGQLKMCIRDRCDPCRRREWHSGDGRPQCGWKMLRLNQA